MSHEDPCTGPGIIPDPLPGPHVEPPAGEQAKNGDIAASPPGSVPLISEHGNPRFPRSLLVGGGYDILSNPINQGLPEWLVSATALDLHVSIEAVLLNLVDNALKSQGKSWPGLLKSFGWFPKALMEISPAKREERWDWIISQKPEEANKEGAVIRPHTYWMKGYGSDKAKNDKLIEMNCCKTLNYSSFFAIIRKVADEVSKDNPDPVEVGHISRRHWNDLKEPSLADLKVRVGKKKSKLRSKSLAAKKAAAKKALQSTPDTANLPEGSLEHSGAPAPVAGQNLPVDNDVQVVAEVSGTKDQPRVGNGAAPRGAPLFPIIQTPPVFPQVANPPPLGQGHPGGAHKRPYVETPNYSRGYNPRGYGRNRGGGYGGRNKKFFPRGPRGGGGGNTNTNYRAPGLATNTSRGGGGNSQGEYGGRPAFMAVNCWSCQQANPSQNTVCSYCYQGLY